MGRFDGITKHPLTWPSTWPRTPAAKRQRARFDTPFSAARDHLFNELERLRARLVVVSSNVPLRKDGLPYASFNEPSDPGVAAYFILGNGERPHVLACDRWDRVRDNIRAIGLHIAAIRGIERWGVGSIEQAFAGYQALPESPTSDKQRPWYEVLNVKPDAPLSDIKAAYRQKVHLYHPDVQKDKGNHGQFIEINQAWEQAQKERSRTQ